MPLTTGLTGQRVLVTAASQGIGFGAARAFLEEGARVVVNSSKAANLELALEKLRPLGPVSGVVADLTRHEDLDRLVERARAELGGIDTLAYVTGSPAPGVFLEQGYDEWRRAAELLVVSPAYLARRVADAMIAGQVRGRMVFLGSIAMREPIPTIATSSVCRIAIAGLVRTLARELGPHGIRVNGILPGHIRTARTDQVVGDIARRRRIAPREALAELEREIPLGRLGTTEELARSVVFLGSDLSAYVTGALLPVDGGLLRSVG
jgi:3-oxoacyl-[acyl-carrier protein] reductase